MPEQTVTLELPEPLWEWAKRTATVTQRPVEKVLVDSLSATMPPPLDDIERIWHPSGQFLPGDSNERH